MDKLERIQIELIMDHLCSETLRKTADQQNAMIAEQAANGTMRSGATIKRAVAIIEDRADDCLKQAINQVSEVARDVDAFDLIVTNLNALFSRFKPHFNKAVRLSTGGDAQRDEALTAAAEKLFAEARTRMFKQLEIHRFSFANLSKGDLEADGVGVDQGAAATTQDSEKRNPGGKPLAAHWDAMWAAIAVKLWTGELVPKSQADVKRAMFDWFNNAEIEIGDTALTQRARQLWQLMQDASS